MLVNGLMITDMVMEKLPHKTELFTKETGLTIKNQDKELKGGKTEVSTMGIIVKARNSVKAFSSGQMDRPIKVHSATICLREMAPIDGLITAALRVSGR